MHYKTCFVCLLVSWVHAGTKDACNDRYSNQLCADASFMSAFKEATATGVNKVVADGIFDAMDQQRKQAAMDDVDFESNDVSYEIVDVPSDDPSVSWLCDSPLIKHIQNGGKQFKTFHSGTTCQAVTSNIRSLIQVAKSKEMDMQRKVQIVKTKLLNSNTESAGYSRMRFKVMGERNTANAQRIALDAKKATLERQIAAMNNEIRDLQNRIKKDGWNNWWRGVFGKRDEKKVQLQNKVNELRNLHTEAVSTIALGHRFQDEINQLTSSINQIKVHIHRYEAYTKSLGRHITDLKNIENHLGLIAVKWSSLDEKCADIEDDPILFEDLADSVNTEIRNQAKHLATIICNDGGVPALPTVKLFKDIKLERAKIGSCSARSSSWNIMKGGNMVYIDRHRVSCGNNVPMSMFHLQRSGGNIRFQFNCCILSGVPSVSRTALVTPFSSDGGGNFMYMDRHSINCGHNGFITSFKIQRNGRHNNIRYYYTCISLQGSWEDRSVCYNSVTPWSADGNGDAFYLDRQTVSCNAGYALSYFKLQRNSGHNYVHYRFRCCKAQ